MPALRAKRTIAVSRTLRRFRHPHLSFGVVYTAFGAFQVHRGIVEAPEDVGTRCRWEVVEDDNESRPSAVDPEHPTVSTRAY
jgi:hypothetical protein